MCADIIEPMTLSARALDIGSRTAVASDGQLSHALCQGLQDLLGWPFKIAPEFVFDGQARSEAFAAVVYTAPDHALTIEDGGIPADNAAVVIDAIAEFDIAGLRHAYTKIVSVKRLQKSPAPILKGTPVSTNTLGIIFAQRAQLPIERFADELERLNSETPSEYWPDMIVLANVGVINYCVQFPGVGVGGDHLPPAPGAARGKPPPIYVSMVIRPVTTFTFNKMAAFLVGHLAFFSPGGKTPNFQHLLEGMPDSAIVLTGYQFNLSGELVPVPSQFYNDRYIPAPPLRIEDRKGGLMATIQLLPWQDGGVIMMRGKLPLEGLMVFLDPVARKTLSVLRPPSSDLQLSFVLPISVDQFAAFLKRFQLQSNMIVKPSEGKWIAQKLANEGASSPFMARLLMGAMRMRDAAYPDPAAREGFDNVYESISTSLISARDTAKDIDELWRDHVQKVTSGTCVRRTAHALHIDDNIDRDLRRLTESFLNASTRVLKYGLQQLAIELGTTLAFWFQKQQAFERAVTLLANTDALLSDYLVKARSAWSEKLVTRRNAIEHDGWALPEVTYREKADVVSAIEPEVDDMPVREFVSFMLDRLSRAVEEITMHLLATRMPEGIGLHEIERTSRDTTAPERFRITTLVGGEPLWRLEYGASTFDES